MTYFSKHSHAGSTVVFIPQNHSHLDNMLPIARELRDSGVNIIFISVENYVKQRIFSDAFEFQVLSVDLSKPVEVGFYNLGLVGKLRLVSMFKKNMPSLKKVNPRAFVVCNDGALQRCYFSEHGNSLRILLLDGIVSNYGIHFSELVAERFKVSVLKEYLAKSILEFWGSLQQRLPSKVLVYFPSVVGTTKVDSLFVVSQYVKDHLTRLGVNSRKVYATGLPRFKYLHDVKVGHREVQLNKSRKIRILFISQGFKWHNEYNNNELQHEELQELLSSLRENKNTKVVVRVHPRDSAEDYSMYPVEIETSDVDPYVSLMSSNLVVGLTSTMILEAMYFGLRVACLRQTDKSSRLSKTLFEDPRFPKIRGPADLRSFLSGDNNNAADLEYFFNPWQRGTIDNILKQLR